MTGTVISTTVNGVHSTVTPNSSYAAPSQIATNTLSSTMNWSSFLGLSSATGPNGDSGSINYDGNARPASTISPYGAVTTYTYADTASPPNKVATTNGHWVVTTMDGFGRTNQTLTGYGTGSGTTTLSTVDAIYAPCGCSPLGKLSKQSQPYAPGGSDAWTSYGYDASGRTLTVLLAEGSTTTYQYAGNWVSVTDAAGHWKSFNMDAFGNLTSVIEPDPTLGVNVATNYTYDVLSHLTQVSMPRGNTTQTRTFNYNLPSPNNTTVTGFLQSATNPENGTVNYTYSGNLLASKTDAKNQKLTYAYDTYNRLTSVTLGASQVLRTYYYDTLPSALDPTGTFAQNALGRLTAVQYPGVANYKTAPAPVQLNDMYSYTQAGLPATKRMQVNQTYYWKDSNNFGHQGVATANLDGNFTYNSEGKMTAMTYPSTVSGTTTTPGASYNYAYDSMYRLSGMTSGSTTIVNGVSYNAANQLLGMTFNGISESSGYNVLNQLTSLNNGSENLTYTYPTRTNNGKISSMSNAISGETVTYTYDSLNRLLTAAGTGGGANWGEQYGFDGFGNLLSKTVTAGSGPSMSVTANAANNQIGIFSYDANGNAGSISNGGTTVSFYYDAENRISVASTNGGGQFRDYAYDAQNRRSWSWAGGTDSNGNPSGYSVNVYSPSGQKLGVYQITPNLNNAVALNVALTTSDQYFGGRRLAPMDQLGSAGNNNTSAGTYFPWGEPKGSTNPQDAWSYATYWTDSFSSLDYANNRYYSNAYGRFMTPDHSASSLSMTEPQSWNRYSYVLGDPVNSNDPSGLCTDMVGGVTMVPGDTPGNTPTGAFNQLANNLQADTAYPYPDPSHGQGYLSTVLGSSASTQTALQSLQYSLANNSGSIDVITDSAGAQAFANAFNDLSAADQARIGTIVYLDPAMVGTLPAPANATVFVVQGSDWKSIVATLGTTIPIQDNVHTIATPCDHTNQACLLGYAPLAQITKDGSCSNPRSFVKTFPPPPKTTPFFFMPALVDGGGGFGGLDYLDLMFGGGPPAPVPVVTSTISY